MTTYYNPTTGDTAKVNSDKADKNGDVWVEINGGMQEKRNWKKFITIFTMFAIVLLPAIGLWWLTDWLGIVWVFWGAIGLSALIVLVGSL